jgi:hypothetical protein
VALWHRLQVYVSVFETGSSDATATWLHAFGRLLSTLGVHHTIVAGGRESLGQLGKNPDRIKQAATAAAAAAVDAAAAALCCARQTCMIMLPLPLPLCARQTCMVMLPPPAEP